MNKNKINISEILNKWFEMKYNTYDKLDDDYGILLYYKGDEFADIMIDKTDKIVFYSSELYFEFSNIVTIKPKQFESYVIKWAEKTFNLIGFIPREHYRGVRVPKDTNLFVG